MLDIKDRKTLLQIFLSIILGVATAHVLQTFLAISQLSATELFLNIITILVIFIALALYIFDTPTSKKLMSFIFLLKVLLIIVVAMTLLAIARFVSFYFDQNIQLLNVKEMFSWIWGLVLVSGVLLIICAITEYGADKTNKKYIILAICSAITIIIASYMFTFGDLLLQLRGVIK